ncbi:hypothetical protein [Rubrimonas cliftonensis]|uniref:DM13 domain-containing protein n=1 Tax=Rubrimonas cliftonensis TaxID=89524 RepID=A0A1H4EKV0_9RHOB|nr:hypothetical protein [Rubrimonas cliftonensis]SEA85671.1 hypothetical protein SAMN05444370_11483 [Rubrimonas cliftonensis]
MIIGQGAFTPGNGHDLRGGFTLTRQRGGVLMRTSADFFFDGSPEPGWALTLGLPVDAGDQAVQAAATATDFQRLPMNVAVSGEQTGLIPEAIDLDAYNTLFLWCYRFPFILGVGPIERV